MSFSHRRLCATPFFRKTFGVSLLECMFVLVIASVLALLVLQYSQTVHQLLARQFQQLEFDNEWLHVTRTLRMSLKQAGNLLCEKIKTDSRLLSLVNDEMTTRNFLQFDANHLQVRYVDRLHAEILALHDQNKRLYVRGNDNWHEQQQVAIGDCREMVINQIERVQSFKNNLQIITLKKALPLEFRSNMRIAMYHHLHFVLRKNKNRFQFMVDDGMQKTTLSEYVSEMKWFFERGYSIPRLQLVFETKDRKVVRWV